MGRTGLFLGVCLAATLTVACSRSADERADAQEAALAARDGAAGEEVTITGCLTGSPDRDAFAVTAERHALTSGALYAGSGETPTYTYELTGNTSGLSGHVGQQVQVTGRLDKSRDDDVDVEDEEETKLPEVQSGKDKVSPAIETDTEMEIKVRRLTVSSLTPTGRACVTSQF